MDKGITIGLNGFLFMVLLVLKLGGVAPVAAWSWWLVCLPLYIVPAIAVGIFGIVLFSGLVVLTVTGAYAWIRSL